MLMSQQNSVPMILCYCDWSIWVIFLPIPSHVRKVSYICVSLKIKIMDEDNEARRFSLILVKISLRMVKREWSHVISVVDG